MFILVAALALQCLAPTWAQAQKPRTLQDAIQTKEVLDRAFEAYGGVDFLDSMVSVEARLSGAVSTRYRNLHTQVNDHVGTVPRRIHVALQRDKGRFLYEGGMDDADRSSSLNGSASNFEWIITDTVPYLVFTKVGYATRGFGPPSVRGQVERQIPHVIVAVLAAHRSQARWAGRDTVNGKPLDRIVYPEGVAGYDVLFFDHASGFLDRMEGLTTDPARGDVVFAVQFLGYHGRGRAARPSGMVATDGRDTLYTLHYDAYDVNAKLSDSTFAPAPDVTVVDNSSAPSAVRTDLPNVFMDGPNQPLVVVFRDYAVVVGGSFQSERTLATIRERLGDTPIRYAIPTHHHARHIRGLRSYVNAGITIISTARNRDFFAEVARAPMRLNPDQQQRHPRPPTFEIVDDRRVFDDGTTRLEIINVGPVGHAEDLYVAYLPKEGIVYTEDLFEFDPAALPLRVAPYYRELAKANYQALKDAGIDAKTVIRGHRGAMPMATLERLIFGP